MKIDEFVFDLFTRFDAGDVGVQTDCIQDLNKRLTADDALAEALKFYADEDNYPRGLQHYKSEIECDQGATARTALRQYREVNDG